MADIISLLGYVIAATMAVVAFMCWKKAASFHALLIEGSTRIDALKQHSLQLEKERTRLHEKLDQNREAQQKLEKQLNSQKFKVELDQKTFETRALEAEEQIRKQELRIEHLTSQVDAMTKQLKEAEAETKEWQSKLAYVQNSIEQKVSAGKAASSRELEEVNQKLRESERKNRALQEEVNLMKTNSVAIDQEKIQDLQRKSTHFERLYKSMRGLREMSDERNRNWEVALRKFATFIVKSQSKQDSRIDEIGLGPVVGMALEIIGENLLEDEFSDISPSPIATGASSAAVHPKPSGGKSL